MTRPEQATVYLNELRHRCPCGDAGPPGPTAAPRDPCAAEYGMTAKASPAPYDAPSPDEPMTTCPVCAGRTRDGLMCQPCWNALARDLRAIPDLIADLDTAAPNKPGSPHRHPADSPPNATPSAGARQTPPPPSPTASPPGRST
jgi:hypothetical protein